MVCFKYSVLCLLVCLLHKAATLYEDQVGLYDWYQQYVGPVSYVSIDSTSKTNRGIIVASETGVLAAIDPHTGDLEWRKVFAPGRNGHIDAVLRTPGGSLLSVSKSGKLIRSWDMRTGLLKWETVTNLTVNDQDSSLCSSHPSYHLNEPWRPCAVHATLAGPKQSLVAVAASKELAVYSVKNGETKWTQSLDLPNNALLTSVLGDENTVHVLAVIDHSKLILSTFAASTGDLTATRELASPWISVGTSSCLLTKLRIICLEPTKLDLYHAPLSTDAAFKHVLLSSKLNVVAGGKQAVRLFPVTDQDSISVAIGSKRWTMNLQGTEVSVTDLSNDVLTIVGGNSDVSVGGSGRKLAVEEREYDMIEYRGRPMQGAVQLSEKGSDFYRLVLIMEDNTIVMLSQDEVVWSREDALGAIAAIEMLDLPAGQSEQIEAFVEMTKSEANPLKVAILRAQLQFTLTKEFLMNLNKEVASLLHFDGPNLVRDQFNTRKLIIAATANGKMYGVDSRNGDIVWQSFLSSFAAFQNDRPLLYILRTTSHPPHPPLAVLIGRSQAPDCQDGTVVYEFNPLTGESQSTEPVCLPFQVLQTLLLSTLDSTHSKILLLLTSEHKVVTYPSSPEIKTILSDVHDQLFLLVAQQGGSDIAGYRVLNEQGHPSNYAGYSGQLFDTEQFWKVQFPTDSERIIAVQGKKASERVSSQGDVLADRSVQYKYLNPNLVAVVTESVDPAKGLVTVYLIDSVTGGIVHQTSHKNALGPVHLVLSENWLIYEYLNSKQRRHELVVLELYETHTNQSHTVWSSLAPPPSPEVLSQAYAFPTSPTTLTTTQTLRGITYKAIIFGLHSGRVTVIPKSVFNPRRELEMTDQMKEDGILPYHPEIPLTPLAFLNYNRTVARIRDIYTTPSGLESTCLVLVCGLDLYYTRVTPSKQFDLLADDFDYTLISAVVVVMFLATVVLSRLAARKTLKALWK